MIHKFSLIAEFEFDDELDRFEPPTVKAVERQLRNALPEPAGWLDMKETHFEVSAGSLSEAFRIGVDAQSNSKLSSAVNESSQEGPA